MAAGPRWWAARTRQAVAYLGARVRVSDLRRLEPLLAPAQLDLFRAMHPADQRHGLAVHDLLVGQGARDPDLLVAALLHDAGKGRTGLVPRVIHALGQGYGGWIPRAARRFAPLRAGLDRLAKHPAVSADLAARAGCSARAVALIRWQEAPRDAELGPLLRLADEAN